MIPRRKVHPLIIVGMFSLSGSQIITHYFNGNRFDFALGLSTGAPIGLMLVGLYRQSRFVS